LLLSPFYKAFLITILLLGIIPKGIAQHDTSFFQQYPKELVVTLYQSVIREHVIQFSQDEIPDKNNLTTLDFASQSKNFTGLAFDYDLFGLSIGVNTFPNANSFRKGKSQNTNISFSLGTNKIAFESSYRHYKGFYEQNTANYTLGFNDNTQFFKKKNMQFNGFKMKAFYYHNHKKFSYKSAYASTHRQLKSAWSPVLTSGIYYNNLSTDSTFFPAQVSPYYSKMKNLTYVGVWGLSTGIGFSSNLVFLKKMFLNTTVILALESQWRNYAFLSGADAQKGYLALGGDFRGSLGYNSDRIMCFLSAMYDFSQWNNADISINNQFLSAQLNFAYRFIVKKPAWYPIIEKNALYKWF
jgi:hypothetical protein